MIGIPLLIISYNAINLEKPSAMTMKHVKDVSEQKINPKDNEIQVIKKLKAEMDINKNLPHIHKKRKAKGPNPLSCLKSKKLKQNTNKAITKHS